MCLMADEKILYVHRVGICTFIDKMQIKNIFSDVIYFENGTFYMNVLRRILIDLGIQEYKTRIFLLENGISKNCVCRNEEYVLLCPEASCTDRSLDSELCDGIIKVINFKSFVKGGRNFSIIYTIEKG